MARLIFKLGDGKSVDFDLSAAVVTLGRSTSNDIVINNGWISSHHAKFERSGGTIEVTSLGTLHGIPLKEYKRVGGAYTVIDLDSHNGVMVNGTRVSSKQLNPGDVLTFGQLEAVFEESSRATVSPPRMTDVNSAPAPAMAVATPAALTAHSVPAAPAPLVTTAPGPALPARPLTAEPPVIPPPPPDPAPAAPPADVSPPVSPPPTLGESALPVPTRPPSTSPVSGSLPASPAPVPAGLTVATEATDLHSAPPLPRLTAVPPPLPITPPVPAVMAPAPERDPPSSIPSPQAAQSALALIQRDVALLEKTLEALQEPGVPESGHSLARGLIQRIDLLEDLMAAGEKSLPGLAAKLAPLHASLLELLREHSIEPYTPEAGQALDVATRRRITIVEPAPEGEGVTEIAEIFRPGYQVAPSSPGQPAVILRKAEVRTLRRSLGQVT